MRKADRSLFGRWLETEINSRGMTQTEFAVASGAPVATLRIAEILEGQATIVQPLADVQA